MEGDVSWKTPGWLSFSRSGKAVEDIHICMWIPHEYPSEVAGFSAWSHRTQACAIWIQLSPQSQQTAAKANVLIKTRPAHGPWLSMLRPSPSATSIENITPKPTTVFPKEGPPSIHWLYIGNEENPSMDCMVACPLPDPRRHAQTASLRSLGSPLWQHTSQGEMETDEPMLKIWHSVLTCVSMCVNCLVTVSMWITVLLLIA